MVSNAQELSAPDEQAAVDRKAAKYNYLLPRPSPELLARMLSGQPSAEGSDVAVLTPPEPSAEELAAIEPVQWEPIDDATARDKALGCLLGLAIGDALGAAVKFAPRGSFPAVKDLTGGGPYYLQPGQWTGDTSMTLCLAESLLAGEEFDVLDFMTRLRAWLEKGENTADGKCFDIGHVTWMSIQSFMATGDPLTDATDPLTAGNGSLVRLAPVAIASRASAEDATLLAQRQCRATHAAQECLDGCSLFAAQLVDALNGADKNTVLRQRIMSLTARVLLISAGDWKEKSRDEIRSSGYVVHTLEAAVWCVWTTDNFRDAVLLAANLGEHASSVAAVTGQLAGALYGAAGIPAEWRQKLAWREKIESLASALFERSSAT